MQNIRLTLQYDGTRYAGWQKPEKDSRARTGRTIASRLQSAIGQIPASMHWLKPSAFRPDLT